MTQIDFGGWEQIESEEHFGLESVLGDISTQRLGSILYAWELPTGETNQVRCGCCAKTSEVSIASEIIEHWCVQLQKAGNKYQELDVYYRYRPEDSGNGHAYRTIEEAIKGTDGRGLTELVSDACDQGLILPDDWR